jgi:MFS family permease
VSAPAPEVPPGSPHEGLWSRGFLLANAANFLFFTGLTTFFVLPLHLENLGASRAEVGRVMGSFGFTTILAIPATGMLVDRFGRRPFMLAGGVMWVLAATAFSTVSRIGAPMFGLRMVQGVAFALAFVSTNALVADLAPPRALGRAISVFGTTTLATHALGPTVGEYILRTWGFRTLCAMSAGAAAAALVAYASMHEPARPPGRRGPADPAGTLLALASRPLSRSALGAGVASALAFGAAMNFMPIFVRARHLPSVAPFFGAYVLAAGSVRLLAGGLGDRVGYRRVAVFALGGFACTVAAFSQVRGIPLLVLLALGFGVTHGWTYPALNALFLDGVPPAARGRAMALYNLSFNLGITLAAFSGGEIAQRFGYSRMWMTMGALSLLGVVALLLDRQPAPPS